MLAMAISALLAASGAKADAPLLTSEPASWLEQAYAPPRRSVDPATAMYEIREQAGCCDECETCDDCCCCPCPCLCWFVQADGLLLQRSDSDPRKLVENGTGGPPRGQRTTVMTTDALDTDPELGPRIVIGCRECDHDCEFIYYGFNHWNSTATATTGNPEVDVPFDSADFNINGVLRPISDFDGAQAVTAIASSELHNFEANRWLTDGRVVDILCGFRYLNLDEEFDLRATDTGQTSDYLIDADNHLVGLQTGARYSTKWTSRFNFDLLAKAGAYINFADQHTLLRDDNNTVLIRDFHPEDEELAFIGEIGLNCRYAICERVELTFGYLLVWVDGLALGAEQLDFTTTDQSGSFLNTDGDVFFDGGYAGVRVNF